MPAACLGIFALEPEGFCRMKAQPSTTFNNVVKDNPSSVGMDDELRFKEASILEYPSVCHYHFTLGMESLRVSEESWQHRLTL